MTATSAFLQYQFQLVSKFPIDLAVIFRPGIISHPQHEMLPKEHALSQRVLEFLIAQQDWFMLDISPPPTADENDDELRGGGKPPAGGGGGGNNTHQPGQGTTKWREGTSTPGPSRQGTGLGAAGPSDNAEAGPSTSGTTRQRLISGGPVRHNSHPDVQYERTQLKEHLTGHSNSLPPSPIKPAFFQSYPPTTYVDPAPIHTKFSQSAGEAHPSSPVPVATMPRSESPMGYKQSSSSGHGHARNSSSSSGSLPPHPLSTSFSSPDPHPFFHHPPLPPVPTSSPGSGSSEIDDVMVIPSSDEEISHVGGGGWKLVSRGYAMGSGAGSSIGYTQGGGGFMALGAGKEKEREREKEKEREKERERAEKERIRMMRRRTTIDRSGTLLILFISSIVPFFDKSLPRPMLIYACRTDLISNDMMPIHEHADSIADSGTGSAGVTRSRTLPSRSTKPSSSAVDEKENSTTNTTNTQPTTAARTQGSKEKLKGSVREKPERRVLKKQKRASTPSGGLAIDA